MKYYSFVCLILTQSCWFADCYKINRLTRLVQLIASRQDLETADRQQDTANLLDKLNYLELRLNESSGNFQCSTTGQPKNEPIATRKTEVNNGNLMKVMKAFQEEKDITKTLQRQVPEVNKTFNSFNTMLGNLTSAVEAIRGELCTPADLDSVSISAKMEEFLMPVKIEFTEKLDKLSEAIQNLSTKVDKMATTVYSCLVHYNEGRTENGVYTVYPLQDNNPVKVYCDMTTEGGGWTVFQRRMDGSVDFLRKWKDYKQGFGSLTGEFWLGNDNIAALTSTCCYELRIELEDFDGVRKYAKYGKFKVLPESDNYKLEVSLYSGNANDSLEYHNGMEFSTTDRDNDGSFLRNCALRYKGAWWYNNCHATNLNGMYLKGPNTEYGANWKHWRGFRYSLKISEMKLR